MASKCSSLQNFRFEVPLPQNCHNSEIYNSQDEFKSPDQFTTCEMANKWNMINLNDDKFTVKPFFAVHNV